MKLHNLFPTSASHANPSSARSFVVSAIMLPDNATPFDALAAVPPQLIDADTKLDAIGRLTPSCVCKLAVVGSISKVPDTVTTLPIRVHWLSRAVLAETFATEVSVGV